MDTCLQFAWLIHGIRRTLAIAIVHDAPEVKIVSRRFLDLSFGPCLRLMHAMLPHQMSLEVVFPVADMVAVRDIAMPAFEVTMLLIFVADIICLPLE